MSKMVRLYLPIHLPDELASAGEVSYLRRTGSLCTWLDSLSLTPKLTHFLLAQLQPSQSQFCQVLRRTFSQLSGPTATFVLAKVDNAWNTTAALIGGSEQEKPAACVGLAAG